MEDSHLDRIERFLTDQMEEAERKQFEDELEENVDLQEEVSAYIMATEVVEQDVRFHLKEQMVLWKTPELKRAPSPRVITIILLILIALTVASVIWICPAQIEDNWDQFAVVTLEGIQRSTDKQEIIKRLNQYYLSGNYEQAEEMIGNMDPMLKNEAEVAFVEALLAFQEERYPEAAESFALLKENEEAGFVVKDQSGYFYLLTLIRMEDCKQQCQEDLKDMSEDENHLRQNEAERLLKFMGYE